MQYYIWSMDGQSACLICICTVLHCHCTALTVLCVLLQLPLSARFFVNEMHCNVHHSGQTHQKWQDYFAAILSNKSLYQKISEGEMLIRTISTTLLEIFWEFMFYFWDLKKENKAADDTIKEVLGINGLNPPFLSHSRWSLTVLLFLWAHLKF